MKAKNKKAEELAALGRLLEASGADRTRWPAPERLRFAALLKSEAAARRMLSEAAALDRLLDAAPRVSESRHPALAERIGALARVTPREATEVASTAVTPGAIGNDRTGITDLAAARAERAARRPQALGALRSRWQAAGLLAASLLLGVLAGGSGLLSPAVLQLRGLAASDVEADSQNLAFGLARAAVTDEETL